MNYYNEIDPFAAQWLRNLISAGEIPDGEVDVRSIVDVQGADLAGFDQCHFFAGIGGWPYALALAGWTGSAWTGSCPCQPLSSAGQRKGHVDERHLWPAFHALIAECRPAAVFGEQVASADGREWLAGVRADLEHLGYAVGAADLPAAGVGAPHIRQRLFWVAEPERARVRSGSGNHAGPARAGQGEAWQRQRLRPDAGPNGSVLRGLAHAAQGGSLEPLDGRECATGVDAGQSAGRAGGNQRLAIPEGERSLSQETSSGASGWRAAEPGMGSGTGGLADAEHALRRAQHLAGNDVLDRRDPRRQEAHGQPGACGEVRGLAHPDEPGSEGGIRGWPDAGWEDQHGYAGRDGATGSFWADARWLPCLDGKARRVEPANESMADGISKCLGQLRAGQQEEVINAACRSGLGREVLLALRQGHDAAPLWESLGRCIGFPKATVLFAALRQHAGQLGNLLDGSPSHLASKHETGMREMWANGSPACPSSGWQLPQQCASEFADALHSLSFDWASLAEFTGSPLASGVPSRVGRLRGYGNAIVPQVAAAFVRAFKATR